MGIFSLKPTRSETKETAHVVADIDAIDVRPALFRWQGKAHKLRPVTTREYLKVTETFAKMDALGKAGNYTADDLVTVYAELIGSICDTIKREDVLKMTQAQVAAVLQLIIDHVTGRIPTETEKKNKEVTQGTPA